MEDRTILYSQNKKCLKNYYLAHRLMSKSKIKPTQISIKLGFINKKRAFIIITVCLLNDKNSRVPL